jgi:general stress protein 26
VSVSVKLNIHLGTIDEKGDANIHPAWFYYDPSKGVIYFEISKKAKKTVNLRKGGKVYFCVDKPDLPYKGVRESGS